MAIADLAADEEAVDVAVPTMARMVRKPSMTEVTTTLEATVSVDDRHLTAETTTVGRSTPEVTARGSVVAVQAALATTTTTTITTVAWAAVITTRVVIAEAVVVVDAAAVVVVVVAVVAVTEAMEALSIRAAIKTSTESPHHPPPSTFHSQQAVSE